MASRLLRVCGAWRALRVGPGPLAAGVSRGKHWRWNLSTQHNMTGRGAASSTGMPTDEEQATGMERKVMDTIKKGVDPYGVFPSKPYGGTKDDPHLVPSLTNVRLVGCICEEEATETYYFWVHQDKMERCPSCGAHFKLIPCELP